MEPIILAVIALPTAGALLMILAHDPDEQVAGARAAAVSAAALALGVSAVALAIHTWDAPERLGPFNATAWAATAAVLIALAAGMEAGERSFWLPAAAWLAGAGAAVGMIFAGEAVGAAALLIVSTAGFAVAEGGSGAGLRRAVLLASSDVLAVLGLVLTADDGMLLPPDAGAGVLLLVAGALRVLASASDHRGIPARLQGVTMVAWGFGGTGEQPAAVLLALAACVLASALRARALPGARTAGSTEVVLAVATLAFASSSARWGAAALVAGSLLSTITGEQTRATGLLGRLAPLPGLGAVATVAADRLVAETALAPRVLAVAILMGAGGAALARMTVPQGRGSLRSAYALLNWPLVLASLASVALIAAGGWAWTHGVSALASGLGPARALVPPSPPISGEAGAAFVVAVLGVSLTVRSQRSAGADADQVLSPAGVRVSGLPRAWVRAAASVEALALGVFAVLLKIGIERGFL